MKSTKIHEILNLFKGRILPFLLIMILISTALIDIAPNPIVFKGIIPPGTCEIQMVSETVNLEVYKDSSFVSCTFNMLNYGDSVTLPVGFPVMTFFHWSSNPYDRSDKDKLKIYVDNRKIGSSEIRVPEKSKDVYEKCLRIMDESENIRRKIDSLKKRYGVIEKRNETLYPKRNQSAYEKAKQKILDQFEHKTSLDSYWTNRFSEVMNNEDYPWYIWNVFFKKGEAKVIKVEYWTQTGIGYGGNFRFVKYLLSTGAGWKDRIKKAEIAVSLNDIDLNTLEEVVPANYRLDVDKKTIYWRFINIEPRKENDIYVKYYDPEEREALERYKSSIKRK